MGFGGKGHHDHVKQLTAKGFGKAKATQALKDAGNNVHVALQILERQRDQEAKQQQRPHGVDKSAASTSTLSVVIPSLHRVKPPAASSFLGPSPVTEALRQQQRRLHPCVVQFGSCQYGEACLFKEMPGDVCMNHLRGSCIYGDTCRRRHQVDGVDTRTHVWGPTEDGDAADERLRCGDVSYRVHTVEGMGSKLRIAEVIDDEGDADGCGAGDGQGSAGAAHAGLASVPPPASAFGRILGSVPSYTEPMLQSPPCSFRVRAGDTTDDAMADIPDGGGAFAAEWEPESEKTTHPTPFLDLLKNITGAAQLTSPQLARSTLPSSSRPPTKTAAQPRRARHPCIAQYGSCKYGDACAYIDRDADVCMHFLHGSCRYSSDDCHYRHETEAEFHAKLMARSAAAREEVWVTEARRDSPPTHTPKHRLQGNFFNGTTTAKMAGVFSGPDALLCGSSLLCALPSEEDHRRFCESSPLVKSAAEEEGCGGDSNDFISASEFDVFMQLVEVFPDVKPMVVLQALRMSGGDPVAASDVVARLDVVSTTTDVEDVAAALALATAEEAEAREEAADGAAAAKVAERHNAILTLVSLFPAVEPSAVEVVFSQNDGSFSETYSALLCAQERVARSAIWNESTTAMAPVDHLRVEKLCAMFPGLDAEVVRSAYCAADRQWSRATTALNDLTKEMLHLESTMTAVVPEGKLSGDRRVSGPRGNAGGAAAVGATKADAISAGVAHEAHVESSVEAHAAYLEAEKEILLLGDWRRVREQACLINAQRCRLLGQASAAFARNDGRMAKLLSCEGRRLGVEYHRLNRLAMLALEHERLSAGAMSTLDLHGFYSYEVHDVLVRRVRLCEDRCIGHLRIVTGEGKHSKRGHQSLYPTVMEDLQTDPFLGAVVKVKSIKAGYIDVVVRPTAAKAGPRGEGEKLTTNRANTRGPLPHTKGCS